MYNYAVMWSKLCVFADSVKESHTMTSQMSGLLAAFCTRWPACRRLLKALTYLHLSTRLWRLEF